MLARFSPTTKPFLQFQKPILYPFLPFPFIILATLLFDELPHAQDKSEVDVAEGGGLGGGEGDGGQGDDVLLVSRAGVALFTHS